MSPSPFRSFMNKNRVFCTIEEEVKTVTYDFSIGGDIVCARSMTELYARAMELYARQSRLHRPSYGVSLFCSGKLLNPSKKLGDYPLRKGINQLTWERHLMVGGTSQLPAYEALRVERIVIEQRAMSLVDIDVGMTYQRPLLQAGEDEANSSYSTMIKIVMTKLNKRLSKLSTEFGEEQIEWIRNQTENLVHSIHWFNRADDLFMWAQLVYKLFTGKSSTTALINKWNQLFGSERQFEIGDGLSYLRRAFDSVNEVSELPIVKKFAKLYNFLLVQGVLSKMGLELSEEDYSKLEIRTLSAAFSSKKGMWLAAFDALLFLVERVHEFVETKDICVFLHSDVEYSRWSKECERLVTLSAFVGNLEAHGTSYFAYVSDISDTIERGEAYARFSASRLGLDARVFKAKLAQLRFIKATELTRRSAQSERKAPFGVLIHGPSSVAKSTFAKMMFYHYGKVFDLPTDDHFRYVRNPTDEYWSNFDTGKWCIQMDDIAFMNPNKCADIDPTLKELLNVVNNVPYCPAQAELENKGKTPVKATLVTATTNAITLNALEYFHCPLAVRRRLPYVVDVRPKQEYLHPNGRFIDPSKLPKDHEGYPDFWVIDVMEIVPFVEGDVERAQLRIVKSYTNVEDFLAHFIATARAHEANQTKSMECDAYMLDLKVCKTCARSRTCTCEIRQVEEVAEPEFIPYVWTEEEQRPTSELVVEWLVATYSACIFWMYTCSWNLWALHHLARYRATRVFMYRVMLMIAPVGIQLRLLGVMNAIPSAPPRWRRTMAVAQAALGVVSVAAAVYMAHAALTKPKVFDPAPDAEAEYPDTVISPSECGDVELEESESILDERLQGNIFGTTETQMVKEDRQNVWYNPTVELTRFDLPLASVSNATATVAELRDMLAANCVRVDISFKEGNLLRKRGMCGVFTNSHNLLVNAHLFPPSMENCDVTITTGPGIGITTNVTFKLFSKEIKKILHKDLCMFQVTALAPRKDITKFWAQDLTNVTRMLRLKRERNGVLEAAEIFGVSFYPECSFTEQETVLNCGLYRGVLDCESSYGDCGALAIAMTPKGRAIVGIHALGVGRSVGEIQVNLTDVQQLIEMIDADNFMSLQVEGGGQPQLDLKDKITKVNPLHHKSLTRYLPTAKMSVFGTLSGFCPRPKSAVCTTPLVKEVCEHFGVEVAHGKPVMAGWEPWRKNLVEMVKPFYGYDRTIIKECAETYFEGTVALLPKDWESEMVFLSPEASINGLPGVRFIDGINRNSSMGFPWSKTKREFLSEASTELHPEGVTFPDEIWERVHKIEELYKEGKRAFPVFTAHLKDEAVTFAKIDACKTRVFTGAPVDWSLVVRSRLLPFVRLLQKNKIAFEAGPGTVAQSVEWQYIREHIIAYGEDRIVAGDYGKFDKRMTSDLILAAFQIIARFYKEAGFTLQECIEIMCIGEDTAFSYCSFKGDLMEFLGTNPSGHPLTVVINSIVNSLYMRYCFHILCPIKGERITKTFKEFVNLFTYGDDNVMGVSRKADWFNHTAIQSVLYDIGVEYTMADKTSKSVPFVHIDDISFLKRKWRFDEDISEWLCPLEEESIHKSLTVWTPSGSVDEYTQMVAVVTSANNEYFFYGREVFERHHKFFLEQLAQEPFCFCSEAKALPNWQQLVERYQRASVGVAAEYGRFYAPRTDLAVQPQEN